LIGIGGRSIVSDRRLRAEAQYELVGLGLDDLLGDVEVGQRRDAAKQRDVVLAQLEDGAVLDTSRQQHVADQRPRLHWDLFLVVLRVEQDQNTLPLDRFVCIRALFFEMV